MACWGIAALVGVVDGAFDNMTVQSYVKRDS